MTNRGVRIRGAILIVLGIVLAGFMAWLLREVSPVMQPGGSPSGARFTGTEDQGRMITTLFMALMTAFQVLLHRHTGKTDIPVGTMVSGRNRPELQGLIGKQRSEIPIPVDPSRRRVACTTCPVTPELSPDSR